MCVTCGSRKSHRPTGGNVSKAVRRAVQAGQRKKKARTGGGLVNNVNKKKVEAPELKINKKKAVANATTKNAAAKATTKNAAAKATTKKVIKK